MNQQDCRCARAYYNNKPKLKLQSETTNQIHYKAYQLEKQPIIAPPKIVQKHYDPTALQTSYKSTFTKPPNTYNQSEINNSELINSYMKNKAKNVPFYSETQYNKSYQKSDIKVTPTPKYEYKPKNTKFEGQSSYKAQFSGKQNLNADYNKSNDPGLINDYLAKKPKIAFQEKSSYKDTFVDYGVKPEKQPEYKYQPKNTKFQGQSSYKATFKELPKEVYKNNTEYCPVHPEKIAVR